MLTTKAERWVHEARLLSVEEWHRVLEGFEDASVFQTPAFAVARGRTEYEHFVAARDDEIAAAAQVQIIRAPLTGVTLAYVMGGPMYGRGERGDRRRVLRGIVRALRDEYVVRRRMCLRVRLPWTLDDGEDVARAFTEEGFAPSAGRNTSSRTLIMKLSGSKDDIRKGMDQKWRNCLNSAERQSLEIIEGVEEEKLAAFTGMYREMLARKAIGEPGDIRTFTAVQRLLPERHQLRVILALDGGVPCAGAVCSALGRRGVYLFGATGDRGLRNKASYLVQWRAVQWLRDSGCEFYDLHGINAKRNAGVYVFKRGLAGRNGREIDTGGSFECLSGLRARVVMGIAGGIRDWRIQVRRMRERLWGVKW